MIVPMKKITLFCLAREQDQALTALRDLGLLHPVPFQPPADEELQRTRARLAEAQTALIVLKHAAGAVRVPRPLPPELPAAADVVAATQRCESERQELTAQLAALRQEQAALVPYGDFDPQAIVRLQEHGISVALGYAAAAKKVPTFEGAVVRVLRRDRAGVYFAVLGQKPLEFEGQTALPRRSLRALTADIAEIGRKLTDVEGRLRALKPARDAVAALAHELGERIRFFEARAGMGQTDRIAYLQGFSPAERIPELRVAAAAQGWGLLAEEPADSDTVPTLIRNPAWIRPVKALFDMLRILPGYREMDVSAVFLVFFSIFFAILVGDAGYGLIFLGLTVFLKYQWPKAPKNMVPLLGILSVCSMAWGVITGSYFGLGPLPAPLQRLKIEWLGHEQNLAALCFLLGAVHLTVAHGWNAVRQWPGIACIGQLGWIGITWVMYFVARYLVLGADSYPLPSFCGWLFGASLAAVILFMTPWRRLRHEYTGHIMLPLTVIGCFGDVVSYLRLYLVNSAAVTLILALNELAVGKGIRGAWAGLGAALILFAAHALNILLSALAVLVHGIRLNALEFSSHLGIQWSGVPFVPFANGGAPAPETESAAGGG